jgi:hypothetical protein
VKLPKRLPRPEILIIVGAVFVAFVITLTVLTSQAGARTRAAASATQEASRAAKKPLLSADELEIVPEDYMIPEFASVPTPQQYVPFRPRRDRWDQELIQKYWVDPREIAKEVVGSVNDRNMEQLFQRIP